MLHPGSIGTVHGHGGVVEGRQQILPYIPYLSGVLFQAHEDKPQVIAVQFMSWAFTTSAGLSSPAMRMKPAPAAHRIHQQLQQLPQHILVVGMACNQKPRS